MDKRYKLLISNKNIYREVEFAPDAREVRIGTNVDCEIRLRKEFFFEQVELYFIKNGDTWSVHCSDNLYLSLGDSRKLVTKSLAHGDLFEVKYQDSDNSVVNVEFLIDFDYEQKLYDRKIDISSKETINIGGKHCDITITDDYIKSDSFSINKVGKTLWVVDNKSQYGVNLNGNRIFGKAELKDYDFISFGAFSFMYCRGQLFTDSHKCRVTHLTFVDLAEGNGKYEYPKFIRNPRIKLALVKDKIPVLDPPAEPKKPESNIVMQLLPAVVMLALTVILRSSMGSSNMSFVLLSAVSMGIGIVTSVWSIINDKKKFKQETADRLAKYNAYIDEKKKQIEACRAHERQILNDTYISFDDETKIVDGFTGALFDRNIDDDDFAEVRVGTGAVKSIQNIDYKLQEKLSITDELAMIPAKIAEEYKFIHDAPVTLKLKDFSAVGVTTTAENQYAVLKNFIIDLAVRHYCIDLRMFLVVDDEQCSQYEWLRLLPHLQNEMLGVRNIVCDDASRNAMFEFLFKEFNRRVTEKIPYPHMVVFVMADRGIKRHPLSRYIEKAKDIGVTFVFFEEDKCYLPKECQVVVSLAGTNGTITKTDGEEKSQPFAFTEIADDVAKRIVTKLAPVYCEEVTLEGSLTKNITLYELLNIYDAEDLDLEGNWNSSQVYKSMAAPLGVKSKNEIVALDLNEKHHGPHGLVAGTTGSGKSEILQSYILSMATLFHPYEVGFVIIDFKGGGMVNQFKNLPHLIGAITNIDGREINRSLLSIKAELKKRQALFAQYDINHIDAYIKKFKAGETTTPLPHLILIVDEFAELKMDQPEFMKELISAARIGRSLGVHLILATQKPSGVVDSQIWSNSKFKLCLKVQNKEDSNEVIKTPLAAEIKEPGRAYLQVGNNEIFELFQSAYSGAPASASDESNQKKYVISEVTMSGRKKVVFAHSPKKSSGEQETQLKALVNYISRYCEANGIERLPGICLPPLPDVIKYSLDDHISETEVCLPIGVYDNPNRQLQNSFNVNLTAGHVVIVGSSQSGKTSMLQVLLRGIAEKYSPAEAHVYILDFASKALPVFSNMNHVGGVVLSTEDEKLKNLVRMLRKEIAARKDAFAQLGITSFSSYKEAGYNDKPQIVVMIDNFVAMRELYSEYDDDFLYLCREGASLGIVLVITALQTNPIGYKYLSNFVSRYCLYCNDSGEYSNLFDRCKMEPKHVPGRGLMIDDKEIYEFQTYEAFAGEREIEKVANIREFIDKCNQKYGNLVARPISEIPSILTPQHIVEHVLEPGQKFKPYCVPISMDYETVELQVLNLVRIGAMSIIGREKSGKTNIVRVILNTLQSRVMSEPSEVYIFDNYERQLYDFADYGVVTHYTTDISEIEGRLDETERILAERKDRVSQEGIDCLKDEPLLVFVIKNEGFYNGGISKQAVEAFKRVIKLSKMLKACFVLEDVENVNVGFGASEIMKFVKENKNVFFMDDLANIKFTDVSVTVARQFKKPIEMGDSYWITDKGIQKVKTMYAGE